MEQKYVCILGRDKPDRFVACNTMTNSEDCQRCGWEQTEMLRRKADLRWRGLTEDRETGKRYLKIRREKKDNGRKG